MKKIVMTAALSVLLGILSVSVHAGAYEDMETAMIRRNSATVIELIDRGMDVNTVDRGGDSLLIQAVREDMPELVEALLKRRARLDFRNRNGETAISIAAYLGKLDYVQRLAEAGARLDFTGWPPLVYAVFNNHPQVVEYLIKKGANINAKSEIGATSLLLASRSGETDMVKFLLKHHADPTIADQNGDTPIDVALKGDNKQIIELLREAGARSEKSKDKDKDKDKDENTEAQQASP